MRPATRTTGRGFRTRRRDLRAYRDRLSVHGARSRAVRYVFMGFEPMVSCASNELANSRTHESRTASDRSTTKLHSNRRDPPRSASSVTMPPKRRKPLRRPGGFSRGSLKTRLSVRFPTEPRTGLAVLLAMCTCALGDVGRDVQSCCSVSEIPQCVHDETSLRISDSRVKHFLNAIRTWIADHVRMFLVAAFNHSLRGLEHRDRHDDACRSEFGQGVD